MVWCAFGKGGIEQIAMFSQAVREAIGFYVYRLIDPTNDKTFYVGKGVGNRVFAHVEEAISNSERETAKLDTIREIKKAGLQVQYVIHRHGLTENEAFEVEAALIDAYGLENLVNIAAGKHNDLRGLMTVNEAVALYESNPAEIEEPVILIKINRLWRRGMAEEEIYEATHRAWKVGVRREKARYAFAVAFGIIRQAYMIKRWERALRGHDGEDISHLGRWMFIGSVADDKRHYVGQSVSHLQSDGAQNPIRYVNC